jgi:type IV secretory pathway VirB4 component
MKFSDVFGNYTKIEQKLENILLYYDFLPNSKLPMILMKDGSIVVLFNIDGLDYEGLSEEQREDYSHYIRTAMELLPNEGAGFMFSNLLIRDTAKPIPLVRNSAAPELIRYVQGKKQKYWYELIKQSYSNRILCGLRYYPVERKEPGWQTCISERKVHKFYADQINSTANTLKQGYISFSSGLSRFKVRELSRQEVYASLYELINYATPGVYRPDLSLVEQLARSRYYFHSNDEYLVINDAEYISLVGVRRPPPVSVAMYLRRFYELGFPMIMRQSIGFINKTKLSEEHNRNLPIATSLSMIDSKNLIYVDEINEFRKCIDEDNELPVWWHFNVVVRADNKEMLRERRTEVITLLKEIGSHGMVEKRNLKAGFFSLFPGHDRFYKRRALLTTGNVGDYFSSFALYQGDANPVDYLQDRLKGVFAYNPFTSRERAHHRAVCGPTAGGKSFFVIKDLISHLIVNPMIWVVDLSASYLDLFELLKEELPGETAIMQVSRGNSNFEFNPFLMKDPNEPVSDEQFEFCLGFLKLMAGRELSSDPENELAMRNGLKEFMNCYQALLSNQIKPEPIPPLGRLANVMTYEIDNPKLAAAFQLWAEGRRGQIFNTGRDTIQNARYCYFDLRDLDDEPELMKAIVYVIFSKVYRDVSDEAVRPVQKRFVLDEAHRYISDPAFSFWIELLARTGRHLNIMLDLITQSINDLQSNAILTNLKQAFFFPGMKNIDDSFRNLQLTEHHLEQYKGLDPTKFEVFYWSDSGLRRMLRSVADPHTYWLATTDARERGMKRKMKALFGGVKDAIAELVRVTTDCHSIEQRVTKLKTYFEEKEHENND